MKTKTNIGNVTLVLDGPIGARNTYLLLGLKRPKRKGDGKRQRKRVGSSRWIPPGGGTERIDKSQKHSARREVFQETGLLFSLRDFRKVGILNAFINDQRVWMVHLYLITKGSRNAVLSPNEEYVDMRWFKASELPFGKMLNGDDLWIPRLLKGQKLIIWLHFKGDLNRLVSNQVKKIRSFN